MDRQRTGRNPREWGVRRVTMKMALLAMAAVTTGLVGAQPAGNGNPPMPETFGIKAVTRPSQDAVMGFSFPTSVLEILVRDGDTVKAGQPLVRADDREAAASVELQTIRANSTLDVDAEEKALELAEVELKANEQAFEGGGGSTLELDRARLAAQTAKLRVEASQQRLREQQIQLRQLEVNLGKHTVQAPFDGVVETVVVTVGDSIRESDPVVRVVSVNPLWIDVATPTAVTMGLEAGDPAWCLVRIGEEARLLPATIEGISPVADSVTGARRVRVQAANPEGLPAGLTAYVRFDEPGDEWAGLGGGQQSASTGG